MLRLPSWLFIVSIATGCLVTPDAFEEARERFLDIDGDGITEEQGDCGPTDPAQFPGAVELCDGKDNDCNGRIDDEPPGSVWFLDADRDGYGTTATLALACSQPDGFVAEDDDCDDTDPAIHPQAPEACNDRDDDCDGTIDEEAPADRTWYPDADRDGHGTSGAALLQCAPPGDGYVLLGDDCDDTNPTIHPEAPESCNDIDDDCDDLIDEAPTVDPLTWTLDLDGDGYGDDRTALSQCLPPTGPYVLAGGDCADDDATRHPDAPELCNNIDDDCDGTPDDPPTTGDGSWYVDLDADGYGDENSSETTCDPAPGLIEQGGDCDDSDRTVNPDATEVCNDGTDNNCDSVPDPCSWPSTTNLKDHIVFEGENEEDNFGRQVAVGDLDGDGTDEAIVSAYWARNSETETRNGFIYGLGSSALSSLNPKDAEFRLSGGNGYETAGIDFQVNDVNGDLYDDLLIGGYQVEPDHPQFAAGAAFLVHGPMSGNVRDSALWSIYGEDAYYLLGSEVAIVPDFDSDGLLEVVVGSSAGLDNGFDSGAAFLISGAASGTLDLYADPIAAFFGDDENYKLGATFDSIDLDADGQPELAIGAPGAHGYAGGAAIFHGTLRSDHLYTDADILLSGEGGGTGAGYSLATLGDINLDGYEDLVIGGHHDTAYIVWGSASTASMLLSDADVKIRGDHPAEIFGDRVFAIDDLNQDGVADLAVGTASGTDDCHVYLYFGPLSARAVLSATADADSILSCDGVNDYVISSIAAGDVNGDTVPDLVIGMDWAGTNLSGEAVIVPGTGF